MWKLTGGWTEKKFEKKFEHEVWNYFLFALGIFPLLGDTTMPYGHTQCNVHRHLYAICFEVWSNYRNITDGVDKGVKLQSK